METKIYIKEKEYEKKFKSYYVVWKLKTWDWGNVAGGCLNRTMQYGNNRWLLKNNRHKQV